MELPCRRFGRTNLGMPILSLGGMRFRESWHEMKFSEISLNNQKEVENILNLANKFGFNHIETAKYYGTSEIQLGLGFKSIKKIPKIIQTKIPPNRDPKLFEAELLKSFEKLQVKKIDLLAIHGINLPEHLYQAAKNGGCIDILKKFQKENLIGYIGFSTHGELSLSLIHI